MTPPRFGVTWPDGSYTGGISDSYRDTCAYARTVPGATVYEVGSDADPECWLKTDERRRTLLAPTAC